MGARCVSHQTDEANARRRLRAGRRSRPDRCRSRPPLPVKRVLLGSGRETVERLVREASRVVGLYHQGRQVGFARAVSDDAAFAYLADVYVLPEHQQWGLGTELVREMVEGATFAPKHWLLHTADAHGVYERIGFGRPS